MKRFLLGATALVALVGSAAAADLPIRPGPVAAMPACAQFGGFYVGGNVGWKYRNHDWKDLDNFGYDYTSRSGFGLENISNGSESGKGWEAGVQTGYNFQFNCIVFGLQADWNWTDVNVDSFYSRFNNIGGTTPSFAYSSKEKWFSTLRTRTGLVYGNLLLYLTGGLAWANFDRNHTYVPGNEIEGSSLAFSSSGTRLGFVVGAGTEWALNANWSLSSEFLYMGFEKDKQSYTFAPDILCDCNSVPFHYEYTDSEWVARIGVNYRWGGYAPVVARY